MASTVAQGHSGRLCPQWGSDRVRRQRPLKLKAILKLNEKQCTQDLTTWCSLESCFGYWTNHVWGTIWRFHWPLIPRTSIIQWIEILQFDKVLMLSATAAQHMQILARRESKFTFLHIQLYMLIAQSPSQQSPSILRVFGVWTGTSRLPAYFNNFYQPH